MNETTKKGLLIAVVVLAVIGAAFGAKSMFQGEQMQVEQRTTMPAGFKSEKAKALEDQAQGTPPSAETAGGERDLSGALSTG